MTRKNYLFAGADAGGDRAAVAYTILGRRCLADIKLAEYLADGLRRLACGIRLRDAAQCIPVRWKATRASAAAAADQ